MNTFNFPNANKDHTAIIIHTKTEPNINPQNMPESDGFGTYGSGLE